MRLGIALDAPAGAAPLAALARQARGLEDNGIDVAWLEQTPRTGPPLLTAAALAPATRFLRFAVRVDGDEHPLAVAEAAAVADNCTNGRIALVTDAGEHEQALSAALSGLPFRHEGPRWTIPANRPENDGATDRIVVTPPTIQLALPVLTDVTLVELESPDALVARLRAAQAELAVIRLPGDADLDARMAAIGELATRVRPRLIQFPLPDGLEAYWLTARRPR
jgi:hypothetical protein